MNKQDITIVVFLVILLGGWLYYQNGQTKKYRAALAERQRQMAIAAATNNIPANASAPAAIVLTLTFTNALSSLCSRRDSINLARFGAYPLPLFFRHSSFNGAPTPFRLMPLPLCFF